jgi:N4-gp56 family major capsid protein
MAGATTSDDQLASLVVDYYDRLFLERLTPQLRYDQFAVKKELPRRNGDTVIWNRLTNLGSGYTLTQLSVPGLSAMSASKVSATLTQKGNLIGISDLFDMVSISDPVKDAVSLLDDSAALTIDNYYGEEIGFGSVCSTGMAGLASSARYASCFTQGFPLLINNTVSWTKVPITNLNDPSLSAMCNDRIRRAVTHLRNMNAKPYEDGYYVGIIHPTIADKLMQDTATNGWVMWNQYLANADAGYKGEIGRINGVRFVSTTNAFTTSMSAGVWSAGASQLSAGGTMYGTLIIGKGAYGGVNMDNGNASKITVVDMKPDKADPLGQYGTAGYKLTIAAKILNPSCGVIMVDYITN